MKLTKTKLKQIIREKIKSLKETKKSTEFKIDGITFGKDYQGLKSQNNGVRYYYQKPKKTRNMEPDFGKFIVKISQIVDKNTREKVVAKLKESINESIEMRPLRNIIREEIKAIKEATYDIGMARKGNGTTVYDKNQEERSDYKNIAHISDNGTITYYDKKLPSKIKKMIEKEANKMKESVNKSKLRRAENLNIKFINEGSWRLKNYPKNDQLEKQFKKLKVGLYLSDINLNLYKIVKIGEWAPTHGKTDLPDGKVTIKLIRKGPKIKPNKGPSIGYESPIWYSELAKQEPLVLTTVKESAIKSKFNKSQLKEIIMREIKVINEAKSTPSKVQKEVDKTKKNLIKKFKSKGAYENFGQKELRKLSDTFIDTSDYSDDMNRIRAILQTFNEWCMVYNGQNESISEAKQLKEGVSKTGKDIADHWRSDSYLNKFPHVIKKIEKHKKLTVKELRKLIPIHIFTTAQSIFDTIDDLIKSTGKGYFTK